MSHLVTARASWLFRLKPQRLVSRYIDSNAERIPDATLMTNLSIGILVRLFMAVIRWTLGCQLAPKISNRKMPPGKID
jgi:hypothetical protein